MALWFIIMLLVAVLFGTPLAFVFGRTTYRTRTPAATGGAQPPPAQPPPAAPQPAATPHGAPAGNAVPPATHPAPTHGSSLEFWRTLGKVTKWFLYLIVILSLAAALWYGYTHFATLTGQLASLESSSSNSTVIYKSDVNPSTGQAELTPGKDAGTVPNPDSEVTTTDWWQTYTDTISHNVAPKFFWHLGFFGILIIFAGLIALLLGNNWKACALVILIGAGLWQHTFVEEFIMSGPSGPIQIGDGSGFLIGTSPEEIEAKVGYCVRPIGPSSNQVIEVASTSDDAANYKLKKLGKPLVVNFAWYPQNRIECQKGG